MKDDVCVALCLFASWRSLARLNVLGCRSCLFTVCSPWQLAPAAPHHPPHLLFTPHHVYIARSSQTPYRVIVYSHLIFLFFPFFFFLSRSFSIHLSRCIPSYLIHFLRLQLPGLILSGSTSTAPGFTADPYLFVCFLLPFQLRSSRAWLNICPKVLLEEMSRTPRQSTSETGLCERRAWFELWQRAGWKSQTGMACGSAGCFELGGTLISLEVFSHR